MVRSIYFKQIITTIMGLSLLLIQSSAVLAALPCAPNCHSSNNTSGTEHNHSHGNHEPVKQASHANHHNDHNQSSLEVAATKSQPDDCESGKCDDCANFYKAQQNCFLMWGLDMALLTIKSAKPVLVPEFNNHIPDPYEPPPA